ncbi:tripartite tricarboxylate transporter TctB family protein [Maliponia aquimaris]|uniref:Tripartite tricarboxylate transporter TctB family protein n=1 Tax=Maliponia aquimaris TaxID=1673631 RepID=A0A238KYU9_9RHOB|nr:tripartite tricarboxylate transporter TctB family protein [Maliponia aquimaris]SMX47868.1 Tripartite tricarboxylate transporter TctB family protein [Maliponia aquimaris]
MRFNNVIPGGLLILFALAEIAYARTFPRLHGQAYGPDLFPTLIGIGLIVCGAILVVQGIAQRAQVPMVEIGDWAQDRGNIANIVILLACMVFYILASQRLGFIPCSLLIMTTLLVRFGSSWRASILIAAITTLVIHTLFAKFLLVPLPWGILLPVAW